MKKYSVFGIIVLIVVLMIATTGDVAAKGRVARLPKTMGSAGSWLPRGSLFDFDHGVGFDLPGFGDPLDDGDPFFFPGGSGGSGGSYGGMLQYGEGNEWGYEDGGIDTTKGVGGCGTDECYQATWDGPCEYKCECVVWWDPGHYQNGSPAKDIPPGTLLWGKCSYGDWLHGTSAGDCRYDEQECETTDW